jgi:aspartate aminotransferase
VLPMPPDPGPVSEMHETTARHAADPRPHKMLLQLGTCLDDDGGCAPLPIVTRARLAQAAAPWQPEYLPLSGEPRFRAAVSTWLLGRSDLPSLQVAGGTAALHLAAKTLRGLAPERTFWVPDPTWPNHLRILQDVGARVQTYPWNTQGQRAVDIARIVDHLKRDARAGDAVLLHTACHNPTGIDPTAEGWQALADHAEHLGWVPVLDGAFLGYRAPLAEELAPTRALAQRLPLTVWLLSLGKSLRMYDSRLSLLAFQGEAELCRRVHGHTEHAARGLWSSPPAFEARVVARVLEDPDGASAVEQHLAGIRDRLTRLRRRYVDTMQALRVDRDVDHVLREVGLFTMTGLPPEAVAPLAAEHAIHLGRSGGINLSALGGPRLQRFCEAAAPWLRRT